jgi:hypothetical protein
LKNLRKFVLFFLVSSCTTDDVTVVVEYVPGVIMEMICDDDIDNDDDGYTDCDDIDCNDIDCNDNTPCRWDWDQDGVLDWEDDYPGDPWR